MAYQDYTAASLANKISTGQLKSTEAVEHFFNRIDAHEPKIGAYLNLYRDQALSQADEIDKKIEAGQKLGPLAGVPVAIKDNMCTSFGKTTCASKMLENFQAPYDAHVVHKLNESGAVIIGKTNLDEFAMGSSTENSALKKTTNPWDTTRVTGGSSGGSAAAVSAGLCAASLGSDTGGSIRQPASLCGVVGLKPTYGRVSRYGLVAYGSSLDQIGPLTQDVTDAALMMNVISGHDKNDSTSVPNDIAPVPDYMEQLKDDYSDLKIGVVPQLFEGIQPEVQKAVKDAVKVYKDLGATAIEIEMKHFDYCVATYYVVATAEASSNLARYDGVHYGYRAKDPCDYIEIYSKSRAEGFGSEVKRRIMLGTYALSSGYYDAYYLKALKVRNLIRSDFIKAFEECDCIMMPVSPSTAFKFGEKIDDPLQMYLADIYTLGVNLAGMPGISIPCGFDNKNLPIGLQIISGPFTEKKLLQIAAMYERQTNWTRNNPEL